MLQPLFELDGALFHPTELARGPWSKDAQHGAAPAALMLDRMLHCDVPGRLTRVTVELTRPVPMSAVRLDVSVARLGRQVQRTQALLFAEDTLVARAEGLHLTPSPDAALSLNPEWMTRKSDCALAPPEHGEKPQDIGYGRRTSFARDAVEIKVVEGQFTTPGSAAAWFRLVGPVVDDEPVKPWARLAAACDFSNGMSAMLPWNTHIFANADLTIAVSDEPAGEWVGIRAVTRAAADGIAIAESQIFDQNGILGVTHQAIAVRSR